MVVYDDYGARWWLFNQPGPGVDFEHGQSRLVQGLSEAGLVERGGVGLVRQESTEPSLYTTGGVRPRSYAEPAPVREIDAEEAPRFGLTVTPPKLPPASSETKLQPEAPLLMSCLTPTLWALEDNRPPLSAEPSKPPSTSPPPKSGGAMQPADMQRLSPVASWPFPTDPTADSPRPAPARERARDSATPTTKPAFEPPDARAHALDTRSMWGWVSELSLRGLLGLDLVGQLNQQRQAHKSNPGRFDYLNVFCTVSGYGPNRFAVYACANCSSVTDASGMLFFYRTGPRFRSKVEAEAHLEAELRRASCKSPETRFFRSRYLREPQTRKERNFGLGIPTVLEQYANGTWVQADSSESFRRCKACGQQTDEVVCPNCGEPGA